MLMHEAVEIHSISQTEAVKLHVSISQFQPTQNTISNRVLTMFIQVT